MAPTQVLELLAAVQGGTAKWCRKCNGLFVQPSRGAPCPGAHANFLWVKPSSELVAQLEVGQDGWLLSRRGRSLAPNASAFATHRNSVSSRFDCRTSSPRVALAGTRRPPLCRASAAVRRARGGCRL
jgi:hypothetical protein